MSCARQLVESCPPSEFCLPAPPPPHDRGYGSYHNPAATTGSPQTTRLRRPVSLLACLQLCVFRAGVLRDPRLFAIGRVRLCGGVQPKPDGQVRGGKGAALTACAHARPYSPLAPLLLIATARVQGHSACVRRRAELSVAMNLARDEKEKAAEAVQAAFDRCYNDTAPFRRHLN